MGSSMSLTLCIVTHVTLSLTLHNLTTDCINSLRPRSEIMFVLHKTKLIEIDIKISLITILAFINEIKIFTYSSLTLRDTFNGILCMCVWLATPLTCVFFSTKYCEKTGYNIDLNQGRS